MLARGRQALLSQLVNTEKYSHFELNVVLGVSSQTTYPIRPLLQ